MVTVDNDNFKDDPVKLTTINSYLVQGKCNNEFKT